MNQLNNDIKLTDFILIDNRYYGGKQSWFNKSIDRSSGCGVVAATNIFAYLLKVDDEKYKYLYSGNVNKITKDDFKINMNEVYKYITPIHIWNPFSKVNSWGVPTISYFTNGVKKYSQSKGTKLRIYKKGTCTKYENAVKFIKSALDKKLPIAIITVLNSYYKLYTNHWMTITDLKEDKNKVVVTVSTWGEKKDLLFKELWEHSFYKGLVYME